MTRAIHSEHGVGSNGYPHQRGGVGVKQSAPNGMWGSNNTGCLVDFDSMKKRVIKDKEANCGGWTVSRWIHGRILVLEGGRWERRGREGKWTARGTRREKVKDESGGGLNDNEGCMHE
eukprot:502791-Hanusia_phi.AAC.1